MILKIIAIKVFGFPIFMKLFSFSISNIYSNVYLIFILLFIYQGYLDYKYIVLTDK